MNDFTVLSQILFELIVDVNNDTSQLRVAEIIWAKLSNDENQRFFSTQQSAEYKHKQISYLHH